MSGEAKELSQQNNIPVLESPSISHDVNSIENLGGIIVRPVFKNLVRFPNFGPYFPIVDLKFPINVGNVSPQYDK